ncbi:MAG: bifunctional adenosylcobinamide kinase/adenosylcobinamide-phosphate guanylyltransferase [Thermodesulfobacteriota bacterium]
MSHEIIFVTGGARSGKSTFAYNLANSISSPRAYIATAEPLDDEMKERIKRHQEERGRGWDTIEEPIDLPGIFSGIRGKYTVVLVDCITLWVSNLLHLYKNDEKNVMDDVEKLIGVCKKIDSRLIVVSNEVGMGIVPENRMARLFRDISGKTNQMLANMAGSVYFIISGLPVKIK